MPPPEHLGRHPLTREDLPADLTLEALRHLDFGTLRRLARHDNGVLDAEEQRQFDAAFADLRRGAASLVQDSLQRAGRGGPGNLDPEMRRSYQRTQQRLAEQAARVQKSFPDLVLEPSPEPADALPPDAPDPQPSTTRGRVRDDDLSPGTLEQEVEQTSDTLDLLEQIASLQHRQLEHQESQLLGETRGLFFAFLVSVAVIIAGVAPLVDAEPHDRILILLWTFAAIALAGLAYALVRAVQGKK